jgi:hypothetical protein
MSGFSSGGGMSNSSSATGRSGDATSGGNTNFGGINKSQNGIDPQSLMIAAVVLGVVFLVAKRGR